MFTEVATQFEDWPEDVKKVFDYDPEGAEALLDEAGNPRGADGIRFKTELMHFVRYDLNYDELVASYWNKIGVDVEIDVQEAATYGPRRNERDFEMINAEGASIWYPLPVMFRYVPAAPWNTSMSTIRFIQPSLKPAEPLPPSRSKNRIAGELNQYGIEKFWTIWGPGAPLYVAIQPWIKGLTMKGRWETVNIPAIFARLWIDSELKEAMGH